MLESVTSKLPEGFIHGVIDCISSAQHTKGLQWGLIMVYWILK